jgi:hypothetical protein
MLSTDKSDFIVISLDVITLLLEGLHLAEVFNSTPDFGVDPNKISATTIGPTVVPKELIPPAKFSLCAPLLGSPKEMAKGLAAVCCNENPRPTTNKAANT